MRFSGIIFRTLGLRSLKRVSLGHDGAFPEFFFKCFLNPSSQGNLFVPLIIENYFINIYDDLNHLALPMLSLASLCSTDEGIA